MKNKNKLYGAILGDLTGQPYEFGYKGDYSEFNIHDEKSTITDDTIMTLATASVFLEDSCRFHDIENFEKAYKKFGKMYNGDYYGKQFKEWIQSEPGTTGNSWGNGSLMRVSPCYYTTKDRALQLTLALNSAFTSHLNTDVYQSIVKHVYYFHNVDAYDYPDSGFKDFPIQKFTKFDSTAKTSIEFLGDLVRRCKSTHEVIETAVKAGGDTDTNASIAGEVFSNFRKDLTAQDIEYVESKLDSHLLYILREFNKKFKK